VRCMPQSPPPPYLVYLASLRLCAHVLEVETLKWRRLQGVSAAVLRDQRPVSESLCVDCVGLPHHDGVGDEMHMAHAVHSVMVTVTMQAAVRQRHPPWVANRACLMT